MNFFLKKLVFFQIIAIIYRLCRGGGTGRRAGFQNPVEVTPCRFDSGPRYQIGFRERRRKEIRKPLSY